MEFLPDHKAHQRSLRDMMHLLDNPSHESFLFFYDKTKGTGPVERNKIFIEDFFTRSLGKILIEVKATDREQKITRNKLGLNWAKLRSDWNWGLFKIYAKLINKTKESKCTC